MRPEVSFFLFVPLDLRGDTSLTKHVRLRAVDHRKKAALRSEQQKIINQPNMLFFTLDTSWNRIPAKSMEAPTDIYESGNIILTLRHVSLFQ
jgi:hypothetical protein